MTADVRNEIERLYPIDGDGPFYTFIVNFKGQIADVLNVWIDRGMCVERIDVVQYPKEDVMPAGAYYKVLVRRRRDV